MTSSTCAARPPTAVKHIQHKLNPESWNPTPRTQNPALLPEFVALAELFNLRRETLGLCRRCLPKPHSFTPMQRSRVGLVFMAQRLLYHSTLGWRVIKEKK